VAIRLEGLVPGREYLFLLNGIQDDAREQNPIAPDTPVRFRAWGPVAGRVQVDLFRNLPGQGVGDLTSHPGYPSAPDEQSHWNALRSPGSLGENFGARIRGFLLPPRSGEYTLFLRSGDASQLFLSSSEQSSDLGLVPVASEPDCCKPSADNPFVEDGIRNSQPIRMEAGQPYYFEVLWKAGVGEDYLEIAWRESAEVTPPANLLPIAGNSLRVWAESAGVAEPRLHLDRQNSTLHLAWPDPGYILQSADRLVNPSWVDIPGTAERTEYLHPVEGPRIFFRLRRP
jgi:hypothetical protein